MKKKRLFGLLICIFLISSILLTGCSLGGSTYVREQEELEIETAMELLVDGNDRYMNDTVLEDDLTQHKRDKLSVEGQKPFAVILTCSDSRVPPEILFDQGVGDLFVVRNAGNIVDAVTLGSIEYGAEHLKTKLIVVLGHSSCGAVKATVDGGTPPGSIGAIVEHILPSAKAVMQKYTFSKKTTWYEKTEDLNIENSIKEILKSEIIRSLIEEKELAIVGAKYDIETGQVIFEEAANKTTTEGEKEVKTH